MYFTIPIPAHLMWTNPYSLTEQNTTLLNPIWKMYVNKTFPFHILMKPDLGNNFYLVTNILTLQLGISKWIEFPSNGK